MSSRVSGQGGLNPNVFDSSSIYSNPQSSLDFTTPPEKLSIDTLREQIHKFKQAIMSNQTETAEKRDLMDAVAANAKNIDTTVLVEYLLQFCSLPKDQVWVAMLEISNLTKKVGTQKNEQNVLLEKLQKLPGQMKLNGVDEQQAFKLTEELNNKINSLYEEISKTLQNIKEKESKLIRNISVLKMDQSGEKMETRLKALIEEYKKRGFHDL